SDVVALAQVDDTGPVQLPGAREYVAHGLQGRDRIPELLRIGTICDENDLGLRCYSDESESRLSQTRVRPVTGGDSRHVRAVADLVVAMANDGRGIGCRERLIDLRHAVFDPV